jgi:hypothetical protein
VSKVTVAQMQARLEDRGLVYVAGQVAGGRGPNAALYSVVPSSAYVAALYIESGLVSTAVADVTGRVIAEVREGPGGASDPVELVRGAVNHACRQGVGERAELGERLTLASKPAPAGPAIAGQPGQDNIEAP